MVPAAMVAATRAGCPPSSCRLGPCCLHPRGSLPVQTALRPWPLRSTACGGQKRQQAKRNGNAEGYADRRAARGRHLTGSGPYPSARRIVMQRAGVRVSRQFGGPQTGRRTGARLAPGRHVRLARRGSGPRTRARTPHSSCRRRTTDVRLEPWDAEPTAGTMRSRSPGRVRLSACVLRMSPRPRAWLAKSPNESTPTACVRGG